MVFILGTIGIVIVVVFVIDRIQQIVQSQVQRTFSLSGDLIAEGSCVEGYVVTSSASHLFIKISLVYGFSIFGSDDKMSTTALRTCNRVLIDGCMAFLYNSNSPSNPPKDISWH
jgi:hypothetical protein